MKNIKNNFLIISTLIAVIIVPIVVFENKSLLGGDDGRLFFWYPDLYIDNFIKNNYFSNGLGSLYGYNYNHIFFFPFLNLIKYTKIIFEEYTQIFFYTFSFLLTFLSSLFFFREIRVLYFKKNENTFNIVILCSLVHTFAPLYFDLVFSYLLLQNLILNSIIPLLLSFLIYSSRKNKYIFSIFPSIIFTMFSVMPFALPWLYTSIIFTLILIAYFVKTGVIKFPSLIIFIFSYLILNLYWLPDFYFSINEQYVGLNSEEILSYNLSNSFPSFLMGFYNFRFLQTSIIIIIFVSTFFIIKKKLIRKLFFNLYVYLFLSLFIFLMIAQGNFLYIDNIFKFFINKFPGFYMLRNPIDKSVVLINFIISFILFFNLLIFSEKKILNKKNYISISVALYLIVTLISYQNTDFKNEYRDTKKYQVTNGFEEEWKEFYNLILFLKKQNKSLNRVIWYPLNHAQYVFLKLNKNDYYIGPSPINIFTDFEDLTGFDSIPQNFNSTFQKIKLLDNDLENVKLDLMDLFKKFSIEYLIINKSIDMNIKNSAFFTRNKPGDQYDYQVNILDLSNFDNIYNSNYFEVYKNNEVKNLIDIRNYNSKEKFKIENLKFKNNTFSFDFNNNNLNQEFLIELNIFKNQKISLKEKESNNFKITKEKDTKINAWKLKLINNSSQQTSFIIYSN